MELREWGGTSVAGAAPERAGFHRGGKEGGPTSVYMSVPWRPTCKPTWGWGSAVAHRWGGNTRAGRVGFPMRRGGAALERLGFHRGNREGGPTSVYMSVP